MCMKAYMLDEVILRQAMEIIIINVNRSKSRMEEAI